MPVEKITNSQPVVVIRGITEEPADNDPIVQQTPKSSGSMITTLSVLAAIGLAGVAIYEHKNAKKAVEEANNKAEKAAQDVENKIKEAVDKFKNEYEKNVKSSGSKTEKENTENKLSITGKITDNISNFFSSVKDKFKLTKVKETKTLITQKLSEITEKTGDYISDKTKSFKKACSNSYKKVKDFIVKTVKSIVEEP